MSGLTTVVQPDLRERIERVREHVAESARQAGRDPDSVTIVAVSKTVDREQVDAAYACGLRHFGENRVQDAIAKFENVPEDLVLHLIGTLQTNKVRQVVGRSGLIHSLDRPALAEELQRRAAKAGFIQPVLIQVNVAREEQKHGCEPEELPALIETTLGMPNLQLRGLMTMAPLVATPDEARPVFAGLRELRDRMQAQYLEAELSELSMGMTNDYPVAIREGATIVRIGRAIFADERRA